MTYTLWSRDRLIGHCELRPGYADSRDRIGWLHPTAQGEKILEVITEPSRLSLGAIKSGHPYPLVDQTAAADRIDALRLELRDEHGQPLDLDDIWVNDAELLLQWSELAEDEEEWEVDVLDLDDESAEFLESLDDEEGLDLGREDFPWEETSLPRYQLLARARGRE